MDIRNRKEALAILDLDENAGEDAIKTAYREMVRRYHPDENPETDTRPFYDNVQKAYAFLQTHPAPPPMKVYGNQTMLETEAERRRERMLQTERERRKAIREKQKEKEKVAKKSRRLAYEREEEEYERQAAEREKEYSEAMRQIKALRATRVLEAMIAQDGETE